MTVASTNNYEQTIDGIVRDSMLLTGLMNSRETLDSSLHKDNAAMCRRFLADIVEELTASGVILRWLEFRSITLTSGTSEYTLSSDVLDVLGSIMYQPTPATEGETVVKQIDMEHWNRLSSKGQTTATPTRALVYKAVNPIEIRFWPVPDTTDSTVRYQAHVQPTDMQDGSRTLELPGYWRGYLKNSLASKFAFSQSKEQAGMLFMAQADKQFRRNLNKAQSRVAVQASVAHRTGWTR